MLESFKTKNRMKLKNKIKILKDLIDAAVELESHQFGWGNEVKKGEKFLKYLIRKQDEKINK
jgi:hypothetical protein